jgi:predicted ATP-grasp superfamily ATP-dependent carboligase
VADAGDPAWRSRYARAVPGGAAAPEESGLAGYLAGLPVDRAVLLPGSDGWARSVATLPGEVAARFRSSSPSSSALDQMVDKARFAELARRAGVAHPATWPLAGSDGLDAVPDDAFESAFLKPRDSQAFFRRYGVKGFWVRSREEAARRLREVRAEGLQVQLQAYVPGPPEHHVFVDGLVDRSGTVRCRFVRRRLRMYPADFGNSTLMESIAPADAPEAVAAAERLLAAVGYRGIFSLETKRDARTGACHALELNPRAWWYVGFAVECGADVCRLAYEDALGGPVATIATYRTGQRCAYPYYDWHAARPLARGAATALAWAGEMLRARQPVWAWDDPWPATRAVLGMVGRRLARGRS